MNNKFKMTIMREIFKCIATTSNLHYFGFSSMTEAD